MIFFFHYSLIWWLFSKLIELFSKKKKKKGSEKYIKKHNFHWIYQNQTDVTIITRVQYSKRPHLVIRSIWIKSSDEAT